MHGTDDQFEAYALGRLSDSENEELEEHLLVCEPCRKSLDANIAYISAMREQLSAMPARRDWLAWLRPQFAPRLALGGAVAALVATVGLYFALGNHTQYAPVAALQLTAIRGETPTVRPARELDLTLGSLPSAGGPFQVEVVDVNGAKIWSGSTATSTFAVHKKFGQGVYFVRLYDSAGELLHEYAFSVQPQSR